MRSQALLWPTIACSLQSWFPSGKPHLPPREPCLPTECWGGVPSAICRVVPATLRHFYSLPSWQAVWKEVSRTVCSVEDLRVGPKT